MSQHAILSPSASSRWLSCVGSVPATINEPDSSSDFADQGTAAHELASRALTARRRCDSYVNEIIDVCNDDGSLRRQYVVSDKDTLADEHDGIGSIDADMVQVYVDTINDRTHLKATLLVEQRVSSGIVSQLYGPVEGTGDAIIIDPQYKIIDISDLKYGRGVKVESHENTQLRLYGLGAIELAQLLGFNVSDWRVRMCIHQPRLDHYDEEFLTVPELKSWRRQARERVALIDAGDTTMTPGEKQCKWCSHAGKPCPALTKFSADAFEEFGDVDDLSGWGLGKALDQAELIEIWLKAIRTEAYKQLDEGKVVTGWTLEPGRKGNRAWTDAKAVEQIFKNTYRFTRDEMYSEPKLISPTQAEEALKANPQRWEDMQTYIKQPPGKPTLAKSDDNKPAPSSVPEYFKV